MIYGRNTEQKKNNIMHRCLNVNIEYIQQKRMKLRELKQTTKN